jgi:putative flippase GtrA
MISKLSGSLLARFLSAGAVGFLVDAGVFQVFFMLGYGVYMSRLFSAAASLTTTWYLNRHHVFQTAQTSARGPEFVRHVAVQTVGAVINISIYLWLLATVEMMRQVPILALCSGSLAAVAFNYLGARYWVFRSE